LIRNCRFCCNFHNRRAPCLVQRYGEPVLQGFHWLQLKQFRSTGLWTNSYDKRLPKLKVLCTVNHQTVIQWVHLSFLTEFKLSSMNGTSNRLGLIKLALVEWFGGSNLMCTWKLQATRNYGSPTYFISRCCNSTCKSEHPCCSLCNESQWHWKFESKELPRDSEGATAFNKWKSSRSPETIEETLQSIGHCIVLLFYEY